MLLGFYKHFDNFKNACLFSWSTREKTRIIDRIPLENNAIKDAIWFGSNVLVFNKLMLIHMQQGRIKKIVCGWEGGGRCPS